MKYLNLSFLAFLLFACQPNQKSDYNVERLVELSLDLDQANRLAQLPLKCISNPLPYKSGIVLASEDDLRMPQVHHPAFYGCFDWHSAVHGHWSLVFLMKRFPQLAYQSEIRSAINSNLTPENIQAEIDYFSLNKYSKSFERTYGWAWLLKLQEELYEWDDPDGKKWFDALSPLAEEISKKYQEYLPKLVYPIRVGEHSNTAFGLSFAYDYALALDDDELANAISKAATDFYLMDSNCPLSWEPSGYDFLSPCLQEIDIMRKVLAPSAFAKWAAGFLPNIGDGIILEPGKVIDRSDGKLVHLDGLNFSRAWCLYGIVNQYPNLIKTANEHMEYSLGKMVDGDYAGEHWLASFALYAFKTAEE